MSKNKARSTEADASLGRIGPVVRASLSETQRDAIRAAFDEPDRARRRAIDLRGVVPMFLTGFYFVFLAGRDRRHHERESVRRGALSVVGGVVLLLVSLVPVHSPRGFRRQNRRRGLAPGPSRFLTADESYRRVPNGLIALNVNNMTTGRDAPG